MTLTSQFVNALTQNSIGLQTMINKHKSEMGFFLAPKCGRKVGRESIPVSFSTGFVSPPSKVMVFKLTPDDGNLNCVPAKKGDEKFDHTTYFLYDDAVSFAPNSEFHVKKHHHCWAPAYFRYISNVDGNGFSLNYFPQEPPSSIAPPCGPCDSSKRCDLYTKRDKHVYVYIAYA